MTAATALVEHEPQTERLPAPINPMDMIERALETNASPELLDKLLSLQERWEATQARKAFDAAMADAKAEIPTIVKNREVDFTSSKGRTHYRHEDLAEIARTVNPILGKYGLSYRFRTTAHANEPISVTCVVTHRLGYYEENTLVGPPDESGSKNRLQQVASTLSYLQRMTLKASLGLAASNDDDGRASGTADDTGELISEEQAGIIRALAEETATDMQKLCELWKVEAIPDLTTAQFPKAVAALETKKRRMAQ